MMRISCLVTLCVLLTQLPGLPTADAQTSSFTGRVDASTAAAAWRSHVFSVTALGPITATLDWDNASADLNLFLYDPTGKLVAYSISTTKRPEQVTFTANTTGTWKVGVKAKVGAASYQVAVDHSPVTQTAVDWPMVSHDAVHSGVSSETGLKASTASSLGLEWQANTGHSTFTSPAVVYDAALGKSVVYQGSQSGALSAYDAATGDRLWVYKAPGAIWSSPAVDNGIVYFGSADHHLYALNATTGAMVCRFNALGIIYSSPVVVDPDGGGKVVYFGDGGLGGEDDGGHVWAVNAVDPNGATDCSKKWSYDAFGEPAGSMDLAGAWSPPAFAKDRSGRPLVLIGSSSTDNAIYAFDAVSGTRVWRYQTQVFKPDNDVGAGPTVSPPGVNGFVDGVVYVAGKNAIVHALNLATGSKIWEFSIRADAPGAFGTPRSTAALVDNRLYLGYGSGVYALNATTGAKVWRTTTASAEVISGPAIFGPPGDRGIIVGDVFGRVSALDPATGSSLWFYDTGGFIYGSAAVAAGKAFIGSSDGFLYAFGLVGSNSGKPETVIESPSDQAQLPNPAGNLSVSGTAGDDKAVAQVLVAIKNTNTNTFWDGATKTWKAVFTQNQALLSAAAATSTGWSMSFPVPYNGGVFVAFAEAIDSDGQHDPTVARANFTIDSLGNPPDTAITSPSNGQVFTFPGGTRQKFLINVGGTAADLNGTNRGVKAVNIAIENREHGEWYCGAVNCRIGGGEWRPRYTVLQATLDSPGAATTGWHFSFPTYDHPHSYRVTAWATDNDNLVDQTRAVVDPICVRDGAAESCP